MNIVAHNLLAMNANRQLGLTTGSKAESTEKLSSGYRINRSADDAAGLAISEKMRRQIRGLTQGVENTKDGVSLCQVADGALAEVDEMLHRISELSVQSANGTNTDEDREAIQQEINEILQEIERISDTTSFNEKLLFGGESAKSTYLKPTIGTLSVTGAPTDTSAMTYNISATETGFSINGDNFSWNNFKNGTDTLGDTPIKAGTYSFDYHGFTLSLAAEDNADIKDLVGRMNGASFVTQISPSSTKQNLIEAEISGQLITTPMTGATSPSCLMANEFGISFSLLGPQAGGPLLNVLEMVSDNVIHWSIDWDTATNGTEITQTLKFDSADANNSAVREAIDMTLTFKFKGPVTNKQIQEAINGAVISYYIDDPDKYHAEGLTNERFSGIQLNPVTITTSPLPFLSSVKQSAYQGIEVPPTQDQQDSAALNVWIHSGAEAGQGILLEIDRMNTNILGIGDLDVSTVDGANHALEAVKGALQKVSTNRSKIGAQQNRLEHTIANEDNVVENTTAAESAIRDTDMAKEMVKFSKDNILEQAGQSMLAQANQSNQSVLSLLQG